MKFYLSVSTILLCIAPLLAQTPGTCAGMSVGAGANLNGYVPFNGSSLWNTDVSGANVDALSPNYITYIGAAVGLHADFGAGTYQKHTIGIPYQVVAGSQPKVPILFGLYPSESDPGPMSIPANALIEGYPQPGKGDRHVLALDKDGCWLYELYNAYVQSNGNWKADAAAVWDMTINAQHPYRWTSADAAGLPVFAGLARYDEVAAGAINHALRFTVPSTQQAFVAPATHWASTNTNPNAPPMGLKLRLRADFNTSGFGPQSRVILAALKKYGMILADNGSGIYISGAPDNRWDNNDLAQLKTVAASNFEVVSTGTVYTRANVPSGAAPTIQSFTANPISVAKGQPVTLSWTVMNGEYNIVSPLVGATRGDQIVVVPAATTTFKLYSTNQFGRAIASVTVTVH